MPIVLNFLFKYVWQFHAEKCFLPFELSDCLAEQNVYHFLLKLPYKELRAMIFLHTSAICKRFRFLSRLSLFQMRDLAFVWSMGYVQVHSRAPGQGHSYIHKCQRRWPLSWAYHSSFSRRYYSRDLRKPEPCSLVVTKDRNEMLLGSSSLQYGYSSFLKWHQKSIKMEELYKCIFS